MIHLREKFYELIRAPGGPVFSRWYFMCGVLAPASVVILLAVDYVDTMKLIENFIRGICGSMSAQPSSYCTSVFSVRDAAMRYSLGYRVDGLSRELMLFVFLASLVNFSIQILCTFIFKANLVSFKKNILVVERVTYLKYETLLGTLFLLCLVFWLQFCLGGSLPHDADSFKLSQESLSIVQYVFYSFLAQCLFGFSVCFWIVSIRSKVVTD